MFPVRSSPVGRGDHSRTASAFSLSGISGFLLLLPTLGFSQVEPAAVDSVPAARTDTAALSAAPSDSASKPPAPSAAPDSLTASSVAASAPNAQAPDTAATAAKDSTRAQVSSIPAPPPVKRNVDSLLERSSWIKIRSRYSASVLLDGFAVGDMVPDDSALGQEPVCIWRSKPLAPGVHLVRLEADLCTPWESRVDLPAGRVTTLDAKVDWTPEEKSRRHNARWRAPRIALGIGTALAGVFALSNSSSLQSAKDQKASAEADYAAATIRQEQYNARVAQANSDADSAREKIALGAILAGLCTAGFAATWAF